MLGELSGKKSVVCADEIVVVGHRCSYKGQKPETKRLAVVMGWGDCRDQSEVQQFLGTCGTFRMFIKDYAKIAAPINKLTQRCKFEWGEQQQSSMAQLKKSLAKSAPLKPIDYESDGAVILSVDTSWMAVGFGIFQEVPGDPKQRTCAKLGSITLNEREARFSQPKRELYGLMRSLQANKYWLVGCRKLIVETDAKYLKGMLSNPGIGPNATIMRWIESVLLYHFTLRHVPGKAFSIDGLSRRCKQPGDEEYPPVDPELLDEPKSMYFEYPDRDNNIPGWEEREPLELEEFADQINTRGGYMQAVATEVADFDQELGQARAKEQELRKAILSQPLTNKIDPVAVLAMARPVLPVEDVEEEWASQ